MRPASVYWPARSSVDGVEKHDDHDTTDYTDEDQ